MGALSQTLNQTEQTVLQVSDLDSTARTKLDSVASDTQKLERTVRELLDQVEFMKNSDVRGERRLRCPLLGGSISVAVIFSSLAAESDLLCFQGRQTASPSTSCSRRRLKPEPTPPPRTPAAPWKPPATSGDSQKTE